MRIRTTIAFLLAVSVIPMSAGAQVEIAWDDAARDAAAGQWRMIDPDSPTPWGDYSRPWGDQPASTCMTTPPVDTTSYGQPPQIDLSTIRWRQSCFSKATAVGQGAEGAVPMGLMPNMGDFRHTYPFDGLAPSDFAQTGSDLLVFSFDLPGDILDPGYCSGANTQLAIGFEAGGTVWMPDTVNFPDDYFGGAQHITTIDVNNCELSATDFVVGDDGSLTSYPGNTLAAVGPAGGGGSIITGITRIPDGINGYRPAIFHTDQVGNFDPSVVGHVWPAGGMYHGFGEVICLTDLEIPSSTTAASTTTTVAETTSTTEGSTTTAAVTTTAQATTTTVVAADATDGDGGFPLIFVFVFLALVIFLLWWFFIRPRTYGPTRPRDPSGPSGPSGPLDPGDPETPGGSIPPELHEEPHECDWAFYLNDGGNRRRIRAPKAGAHECCVYDLEITSFVHQLIEVAKERQDLKEVGRDHASVGKNSLAGVDAAARAGVRSWPFGEQGAMHGRGDQSEWPIVGPTPGPWPEYWQERQFEEQLDSAYSTRLHQETSVRVNFTDGCGDSSHEYTYDASSNAEIWGTAECTNENHLPTCPVELTASALARVSGKGDLNYVVDAKSLTDTDELPPKIVPAGPDMDFRRAEADGHRHDTDRERDTWLVDDGGGDAGVKNAKKWDSTFENVMDADAGLMIPQAMWPTTDRVTSLVEGDLSSSLSLDGEAGIKHSPKSNCCPHEGVVCLCAPSFSLVLGPGNKATLDVESVRVVLRNSDPDNTEQTMIWGEL